ncbi:UDP-3-O-(3-hydroxymyristoyl)glucosamine N-acyltransferase [Akkermansiaceae bacterium]|nr:UDP-3-O-(3-hydroxymyristoyl)glucosamine N-acyltransferase [Akkermansiaceae bacterium]
MKLTLDEIIALTGGKLIRSHASAESFTGLASLDEASVEEVSFLGNEKYYQDFLATNAGVVLLPADVPELPAASALIEVENPSYAFGEIVKFFLKKTVSFKAGIHPGAHVAADVKLDPQYVCVKAGAVIESGATIGNGTEIGSGVVIGSDAVIGEDCYIYANATVRERCVLGDRVILQPGCVVGSDGYGYELIDGKHIKIDQVGIVLIENDVEIGSNTTIDRARFGKTIIGEGTKIDNLVQIAHNVKIGKHCLLVGQSGVAGSSQLGNYVTIAAQAGCTGHVKIGDKAIVASRAAVMKDLDGGKIYMGAPARPMRGELKKIALRSKLPQIIADVKELKSQVDALNSSS